MTSFGVTLTCAIDERIYNSASMTSLSPTPRPDPRRPRTRRAILDASAELLGERGIAQTSIADIAKAAGVSVGSIYGHFGSKDLLLLSIVERAVAERADGFSPPAEITSPLERVLWFGDAFLELAIEHPVAARVLAIHALEPPSPGDPAAQAPVLRSLEALRGRMASDLVSAAERGELSGASPQETLTFLIATWDGVASLVGRRDDGAISAAQARATLALTRRLVSQGVTTA